MRKDSMPAPAARTSRVATPLPRSAATLQAAPLGRATSLSPLVVARVHAKEAFLRKTARDTARFRLQGSPPSGVSLCGGHPAKAAGASHFCYHRGKAKGPARGVW